MDGSVQRVGVFVSRRLSNLIAVICNGAELKTHCRSLTSLCFHNTCMAAVLMRSFKRRAFCSRTVAPLPFFSLFPCMAISPPFIVRDGGGGSKTVKPTMTQSGLNATSSDLPALCLDCLHHTVTRNMKF